MYFKPANTLIYDHRFAPTGAMSSGGARLKQSVGSEILEKGDKLRGAKGVFGHSEKMAAAGAIGGTKGRNFPISEFPESGCQFTFQVIGGTDRQSAMELRFGPEVID